jgi:hypothetical protein
VPKDKAPAVLQIPKDAVKKASIGHSFAEYDLVRHHPSLFVETPAIRAALDLNRQKCFFVGRRGTGKTAVTFFLHQKNEKNTVLLIPQLFAAADNLISLEESKNVHQPHFKTLVSSFKRTILDEVLSEWIKQGLYNFRASDSNISRERNIVEQEEFDLRLLSFAGDGLSYLGKEQHKDWLRFINKPKLLAEEMDAVATTARHRFTILIDRLDDAWNGSDTAVVLVMALMHACMEISATVSCVRPLVFVRENVFERVRDLDQESARLETAVVSLEWTKELLRELIERRLNRNLIAKGALGGPTWNAFIESGSDMSSEDEVFNYCQYRPRDVLLYMSAALESAQSHVRSKITQDDLGEAKRKFSENRLKDLGDEYAENYGRLNLVLIRFYGLGSSFTLAAIEDFTRKLLLDGEVIQYCKSWIHSYSAPELLIGLLYEIGFAGLQEKDSYINYKSAESALASMPVVTPQTIIVIHPTYRNALSLQDQLVTYLGEEVRLQKSGIVLDLPENVSLFDYSRRVEKLQEDIKKLPTGRDHALAFEDLIGEMIKLCFFRSLTNLEPKVRDLNGRVIRDWIAANHTTIDFWQMVRQQYGATQIIWECKNYENLGADDFHQTAYYMNSGIGRFVILAYRGGPEITKSVFEHIRRIEADRKGLVLLVGQRDIEVFLRQAINGKKSEGHLKDLFDRTIREIS